MEWNSKLHISTIDGNSISEAEQKKIRNIISTSSWESMDDSELGNFFAQMCSAFPKYEVRAYTSSPDVDFNFTLYYSPANSSEYYNVADSMITHDNEFLKIGLSYEESENLALIITSPEWIQLFNSMYRCVNSIEDTFTTGQWVSNFYAIMNEKEKFSKKVKESISRVKPLEEINTLSCDEMSKLIMKVCDRFPELEIRASVYLDDGSDNYTLFYSRKKAKKYQKYILNQSEYEKLELSNKYTFKKCCAILLTLSSKYWLKTFNNLISAELKPEDEIGFMIIGKNEDEIGFDTDIYFKNDDSLVDVVVSGDVKYLGPAVFDNCNNLRKLTFGEGVIGLGSYCVTFCNALTNIKLPSTLKDNLNYGGSDPSAFNNCNNIEHIEVANSNPYMKSINGVVFVIKDDGLLLTYYPPKKKDSIYTIPDGVIEVEKGAFNQNPYIRKLIIPETLKLIGLKEFRYCKLKYIEVNENNSYYKTIDGVLFTKNPHGLSLIYYPPLKEDKIYYMPDGVVQIDEKIFNNKFLDEIVVNKLTQNIDKDAFEISMYGNQYKLKKR